MAGACGREPGPLFAGCPSGICSTETMGPPRFLNGPLRARPALRPRGDLHARPSRRFDAAEALFHNPGSPDYLSRLSDAARALAVYASWARSPGLHARLAPGWWPPFAGQDSHLLGPLWKVSRWLRHLSPSPRLNLAQGRVARTRGRPRAGPGARGIAESGARRCGRAGMPRRPFRARPSGGCVRSGGRRRRRPPAAAGVP